MTDVHEPAVIFEPVATTTCTSRSSTSASFESFLSSLLPCTMTTGTAAAAAEEGAPPGREVDQYDVHEHRAHARLG